MGLTTWRKRRDRVNSKIRKSRAPLQPHNYGGFDAPFEKISSPVRPLGSDINFPSYRCKGKCSSYYIRGFLGGDAG